MTSRTTGLVAISMLILALESTALASPFKFEKRGSAPTNIVETAKALYFSANPTSTEEHFSLPEAGTCTISELPCNSTRTSTLGPGDCTFDIDNTYAEGWVIDVAAGQTVNITMRSTAFDSYLFLVDSQAQTLAHDDDSAGGADARITYTFSTGGEYLVLANQLSPATGTYSLSLECSTSSTCTPQVRSTSCGASTTGVLDSNDCLESGVRFEFWEFTGTAGQTVTVNGSRTSGSGNIGIGLFDSVGTIVATEDPDNGSASASGVLTTSGTYIIAIAGTAAINYAMSLQCTTQASGCTPSATDLCLNNNRFRVTLSAKDPRTGSVGSGQATRFNSEVGYYSVPALTGNPNNLEVFVKVLDGRPVNGKFWVFYGGLTDFELTIKVTDTTSGTTRTYTRTGGTLGGGADTGAF